MMCRVLGVSRSGFYRWWNRPPNRKNREMLKRIVDMFYRYKQRYGSPRITVALRKLGYKISRGRVARLMRKAGLVARGKRRFVATTDSNHSLHISSNKLERNFQTDDLGRVWVSDITYIPTQNGWIYLTIVMDLADRQVLGWAISTTMLTQVTTIPALRMAVARRKPEHDGIFHSDRGVQYASEAFRELLAGQKMQQSMSGKGDCWDNAVAESFFKTLKVELVYETTFINFSQTKAELFEFIEIWYNGQRIHSKLNDHTPREYEAILKQKPIAA